MPNVVPFPAPPVAGAALRDAGTIRASLASPVDTATIPLPATGGRRGEYALADLARPLGLIGRPVRAIVDTLRALYRHDGLPLPRSPRIVRGRPLTGAQVICKASLWDAGEIDAWLDGRNPTPPALAAQRRDALRARLGRRAADIALGAAA